MPTDTGRYAAAKPTPPAGIIRSTARALMQREDERKTFGHLADAAAALEIKLTDQEIRWHEAPYTPRKPTGLQ